MSSTPADHDELKGFGVTSEQNALPGQPREVNFVMVKAVRIEGQLVGTGPFSRLSPKDARDDDFENTLAGFRELDKSPLSGWRVRLTGDQLPPASQCAVWRDNGRRRSIRHGQRSGRHGMAFPDRNEHTG